MILLVYETIPENTAFYLYDAPTESQISMLESAHGTIINTAMSDSEQKAADDLSESLAEGNRAPNVVKIDPREAKVVGPIEAVYFAGFLL